GSWATAPASIRRWPAPGSGPFRWTAGFSAWTERAHDPAERRREELELALARTRPAPDQGDPPEAVIRPQRFGLDLGAVENARVDRHQRKEGHPEAAVHHLDQRVERGAHHRRMGAKVRPVARRQGMVL